MEIAQIPPTTIKRKEMPHVISLAQDGELCKVFQEFRLGQILSGIYMEHLRSITLSMFVPGYHGKTEDFTKLSTAHRTTLGHFLNKGKWNSAGFEMLLKKQVVNTIYSESQRTGMPVFCIVDDTIASHTKPSSQAKHPIEAAYFHQSHLKKRQDYGHQAVAVLLACNGFVLNYATVLYDKTESKIDIVCRIADELPQAPNPSYFLSDSWYSARKVIDHFSSKGYFAIGAMKTNRVIFPGGVKQQVKQFAGSLTKDDEHVHLVTVGKRRFFVYRYEGRLNDFDHAVVILSYPEDRLNQEDALRVFLCTNTRLSTQEILDIYTKRWSIEVFFRQCKQRLAFDRCQLRCKQGISRLWLILSFAHFICCTRMGRPRRFQDGYRVLAQLAVTQCRLLHSSGTYGCFSM